MFNRSRTKPQGLATATDLLRSDSCQDAIDRYAGGKGRSLYHLTRFGLPVPEWCILPASMFDGFAARHGIEPKISELVHAVTVESASRISQEIKDVILSLTLADEEIEAVVRASDLLDARSLAVRSSGIEEDGERFSFAGQFSSFLNILNAQDLIEAVKRCWASAYSAECITYRLTHRLPVRSAGMAVVLQEMLFCDKSGVIFTANPVSGRFDEMLLSSVYGLGEGLVSGAIDADSFVVRHSDGSAISTQVGEKLQKIQPAQDTSFCVTIAVEPEESISKTLDENEIREIWRMARRVEGLRGGPQDIEWGIADGRVSLLQTRNITRMAGQPVPNGELRVWDNSNIIESFGGITAPMTYSFANEAYHQVFREYSRLLGVPSRCLSSMDQWLSAMLGQHNGRVYYNLLNWYRVVRLVPFYSINKKALELGIGTKSALDEPTAYSLRPWPTDSKSAEVALRTISAICFMYHFFTIDGRVSKFVGEFNRYEKKLEEMDVSKMDPNRIHRVLRETMKDLLPRWGGMILLEQTISLCFGVFSALFQRWAPQAPKSAIFAFARAGTAVESIEPIEEMRKCAQLALRDPALTRFLLDTPLQELAAQLKQSTNEHTIAFAAAVESYICRYGHRSANELKLEEPDMRDSPALFFGMLRSFLRQSNSSEIRAAGEQSPPDFYGIKGWRRYVLALLVTKVRRSLNARERVRFCRTRAFGITRRMIKAIGENLQARHVLGDAADIFYLRIDELKAWFDSSIPLEELRLTIDLRKTVYAGYAKLEAPERFITHGVLYEEDYRLYGWKALEDASDAGSAPQEMDGTPCSAGVAEGEAEIADVPRDIGGKILVTYRTDPGWCTILPSASALVIERGSPLTHVAIVARELNIPTVVQVPLVTKRVRSGMRLRVDGSTGRIQVLN